MDQVATKRSNNYIVYALILIVIGIALIFISTKMDENSPFEKIVESIGDGFLILGFIEFFIRNFIDKIQHFLNNTSDARYYAKMTELTNNLKKWGKQLEESTERTERNLAYIEIDKISMKVEKIEELNNKLLEIEKTIRLIHHAVDEEAKKAYEPYRKAEELIEIALKRQNDKNDDNV